MLVDGADMRKQANRINFNQAEEEFLDGDETVGLGVLGAKGQVRGPVPNSQPTAMLHLSGWCPASDACVPSILQCSSHFDGPVIAGWAAAPRAVGPGLPHPCPDSAGWAEFQGIATGPWWYFAEVNLNATPLGL